MLVAAEAVADAVQRTGEDTQTVLALVGGGDNGGDALHAAALLAGRGLKVRAALLTDHPHLRALAAARTAGVDIRSLAPWAPPPGDGAVAAQGQAQGEGQGQGDRRVLAGGRAVDEGDTGVPPQPGPVGTGGEDHAVDTGRAEGGDTRPEDRVPTWMEADTWIDGLTGTGLRGALREPMAGTVSALGRAARTWGTRIIAVDVPSGACTEDGTLPGVVLRADHTVTMGALKTTLVLPPAAQYAGTLEVVDLGLPDLSGQVGDAVQDGSVSTRDESGGAQTLGGAQALGGDQALGERAKSAPPSPILRLLDVDVAGQLRVPGPFDHKYTRGVVTVAAGSDTYPGAGVLATMGALGVGPGMVRLEAAGRTARIVLDRHPGVVTASGRAQAAVVGSGLDAEIEPRALAVARRALGRGIPLVLDAGALGFVAGLRQDHGPLSRVVLTPHAGEAAVLLAQLEDRSVERSEVEARPLVTARRLVELTGSTVVLKGSVTLVVCPDGRVFSVAGETGWAGVAGSGDVLAGVMGSLVAQRRAEEEQGGDRLDLGLCAACAVWMHARAALVAAGVGHGHPGGTPGRPVQAEEVAGVLGEVVAQLLDLGEADLRRRRREAWAAEEPRS